MVLAWILPYKRPWKGSFTLPWKDISHVQILFSSLEKSVPGRCTPCDRWQFAPMDVEIGVGWGISEWVGCRKDVYFHTLLYVCPCGAYKEKDGASCAICVGTQPPGNDATTASRCIPAQSPPATPLPSSMLPSPWAASDFHPPQWHFYRACKCPSVLWKLETKCQEET